MAENETQIDLGDEAADNYGAVYDPGMEKNQQGPSAPRVRGEIGTDFAAAFKAQADAQRGLAAEGMRASLAADLLRNNAGSPSNEWVSIAATAIAAATIIYPDKP